MNITEILQELIYEQLEVPCVPTGDTAYVDVDISIYDVMNNGVILHYGDYDPNKKAHTEKVRNKNRWILWPYYVRNPINHTRYRFM